MHFIKNLGGTEEDNHGSKASRWVVRTDQKWQKKIDAIFIDELNEQTLKVAIEKTPFTKAHEMLPCQQNNPNASTNLIDQFADLETIIASHLMEKGRKAKERERSRETKMMLFCFMGRK